ncbi:hypothetical protein SPSYN_02576 [Sporotomaculum syntrophicum]|uniref:Lipoprotein n=1 Tax=Sporotomaculum syntrophicum TaxID=182264 RepID=A0A9D2WPD0_9FIRM|nr:Cys-Cys-COOH (seleno)protein SaoC [Sporotomaculum syntrophicum]KAF1084172.1 hypothetical protein SPSYN_02576 [Sporotomaculum syntrophicum]
MLSRTQLLVILTSLLIFLGCGGCGNQPAENDAVRATEALMRSDALLQHFKSVHPDKEVIVFARADVNNTGNDDRVVIYRDTRDQNMMVVVFDAAGKLQCSNKVPAPATNQMIQFKDIDERPPLEFIASGVKGANYGYAIFRLEAGVLSDLFGEGMEDCC